MLTKAHILARKITYITGRISKTGIPVILKKGAETLKNPDIEYPIIEAKAHGTRAE